MSEHFGARAETGCVRPHGTGEFGEDREATDDAQIARAAGIIVALVEGSLMLEKVTYPDDFAAAEAKIAASSGSTS